MKAINIKWDCENAENLKSLPTEIELTFDLLKADDETDFIENVSDYITNLVGYCHKGFQIINGKEGTYFYELLYFHGRRDTGSYYVKTNINLEDCQDDDDFLNRLILEEENKCLALEINSIIRIEEIDEPIYLNMIGKTVYQMEDPKAKFKRYLNAELKNQCRHEEIFNLYSEVHKYFNCFDFTEIYFLENLLPEMDTYELVTAIVNGNVTDMDNPLKYDRNNNFESVEWSELYAKCYDERNLSRLANCIHEDIHSPTRKTTIEYDCYFDVDEFKKY